MDLINECSLRFAEDKDFRLLVRINASLLRLKSLTQLDRGLYYGSLSRRLFGSR